MGARGPIPKGADKRSSRRSPNHEEVELGTSAVDAGAPKIARRDWQKLHKATREWWRTWLAAPQASLFGATDWTRLRFIVLPLFEGFARAIDAGEVKLAKELAAELRMQEADFGPTPAARRRLGMTIRKPGDNAGEDGADKPKARRPRAVQGDPRRLQAVK